MPVYPSHTMVGQSQPGVTSPSSDYSSMASSTSETPATSSNDHLFDSDSGSTHSVSEAENGEAQPPIGRSLAGVGWTAKLVLPKYYYIRTFLFCLKVD